MKLSDYVVKKIYESTKCEHVFMLTGGMAMHLIESFGSFPSISVVPTHHEQAAGIAASTYARIREVPGVVLVTAGPGALNAVTPCGGAYMESIPMVFISGQVSQANSRQGLPLRQRGVQEVEIVDVVKSITKYAVKITDPESVRYHLEKGLQLAVSGRPGPVWFDIPVDIQAATIEEDSLVGIDASDRLQPKELCSDDEIKLEKVMHDFLSASRPLLILGHGIRLSGAASMVEDLVDTLKVPFQTTWNGMDLIESSHPLNFGRANLFGPRYANIIIQNADYILSIGARFGVQHTGYNVDAFARGAEITSVDIDPIEMEKPGLHIKNKIVMDAREFINYINRYCKTNTWSQDTSTWIAECQFIKDKFPISPSLEMIKDDNYVHPQYFVDRLADLLPHNAMFPFGSSGMGHTVTGGIFRTKKGQRVFTFKGLAAMGYGLPGVVGAAIADRNRPAFTLIGEGGLQLNIQELQTARTQDVLIKVIIFNNGGYHSIHMTQKGYFNEHFVGSGPESGVTFPDLEKIADVYGMEHYSVSRNVDVTKMTKQFIESKKSAFLEVFLDPTIPLEPKLVSMKLADGTMVSRPLEDMAPLLDRSELREIMKIQLIDSN